jgi:hypothetical protein
MGTSGHFLPALLFTGRSKTASNAPPAESGDLRLHGDNNQASRADREPSQFGRPRREEREQSPTPDSGADRGSRTGGSPVVSGWAEGKFIGLWLVPAFDSLGPRQSRADCPNSRRGAGAGQRDDSRRARRHARQGDSSSGIVRGLVRSRSRAARANDAADRAADAFCSRAQVDLPGNLLSEACRRPGRLWSASCGSWIPRRDGNSWKVFRSTASPWRWWAESRFLG